MNKAGVSNPTRYSPEFLAAALGGTEEWKTSSLPSDRSMSETPKEVDRCMQ